MIPLRLVIDTNIVISAALKPDGLQRTVLLLAITKPAGLYVSAPILAEYREVLARPELKIRKGLRLQFLDLIRNHARIVNPMRPLQVAKDPDDNKFLECADAARADYLLTLLEENQGDHLARIHRHRGAAPDPVSFCIDETHPNKIMV